MAELEHEPKSGIDELKIAAVGPLSSLVMAGLFWLIARGVAAAPARALWESVFSQVRDCPPSERASRHISEVMRAADRTIEIAPGAGVIDAIRQMATANIGRLLVIDKGKLVGLAPRTGVTRYVHAKTQLLTPVGTAD